MAPKVATPKSSRRRRASLGAASVAQLIAQAQQMNTDRDENDIAEIAAILRAKRELILATKAFVTRDESDDFPRGVRACLGGAFRL